MKKIVLSLLTALSVLAPFPMLAQDYSETKTLAGKGYAYQYDVDKRTAMVRLYNKENKLAYREQCYTDTKEIVPLEDIYLDPFEDDNWTKPTCYSIVNNAFSKEQKAQVEGDELSIDMYIDSNTGKVIEVCFGFLYVDPYATIPLSVYRRIELELKEKIWFIPTEQGKRLNYIYCGWMHKVE